MAAVPSGPGVGTRAAPRDYTARLLRHKLSDSFGRSGAGTPAPFRPAAVSPSSGPRASAPPGKAPGRALPRYGSDASGSGVPPSREGASSAELAGGSPKLFWQDAVAVCRGGEPSVRGGGAPCSSPLTLHVFWHLPLFPIRPGESQGLRLHFGQHDKAAAGRAGGSVSVRGTGTWTRQHRFSGTVGRSAADASSSSSSSSLPPLRASPCPAAAGAPSGPGRREAPPGARGRESRGAVVGLQAAGAERRGEEEEEDRGCRRGRSDPGSPQQLRPGLSAAAARRPDPCGEAQCTGALCRRRCCWTGFPPPAPSSLPPSSSSSPFPSPQVRRCRAGTSRPGPVGRRSRSPGAAGGSGEGGAPTRLSQPIRRRRSERHPRAHTRAYTRSHTLAQRDRPPPACWPGCGAGAAAEPARPRAARRPPARRAPHCSSRLPPAGPPALACPPAGGQREPRRLGNPGPRDPLPPLCPRT